MSGPEFESKIKSDATPTRRESVVNLFSGAQRAPKQPPPIPAWGRVEDLGGQALGDDEFPLVVEALHRRHRALPQGPGQQWGALKELTGIWSARKSKMLVTLRVLFIHFFICLHMCVQVLVLCVYMCASIHLLICYFCLFIYCLYTTGKLWDPILARALNLCTTNYPMLGSVGTQLFDPTLHHSLQILGGFVICSFEWHFWVETCQVQLLVAFAHLGRCITSVLSKPALYWPCCRWFPVSDLPLSLLQRSLQVTWAHPKTRLGEGPPHFRLVGSSNTPGSEPHC